MTQTGTSPARISRLGTVGIWLSAPIAILQAVNVVRVLADPAAFAAYMGIPLASPADVAWVDVYALRTAFIAMLVGALVVRRDVAALKWTALVALVMPAGDAWLVWNAGAEQATVTRHLSILAYLAVVCGVLWLADRGRPS